MPKNNEMSIAFKSCSENESFARVAVSAFFSQIDPTVDELYDVKMAVSEAVTNCIIHGYEGDVTQTIIIKCSYEEQTIEIEVIDRGKGIGDVKEAMQPLYTSCEEDERAGLGFTVMESMMDKVEVSSIIGEGTSVKLTKTFIG